MYVCNGNMYVCMHACNTTLHYATLHYTTLHYTTPLRYTNYEYNYNYNTLQNTTPHYNCNYNCATLIALHYTTLHNTQHTTHHTQHNTPQNTLHNTRHNTLHYTTPHYTTLHYTQLHYTTLHYITLPYATLITPPQMQLQLHYTNYTTPQLQLHYITTTATAALHHSRSSSWGWGDRPGDHCNHCSNSEKHSSNHLSVHQWIRSATRDSQQAISPIGVLFVKLPPPACAALLVCICSCATNPNKCSMHLSQPHRTI